MAPQRSTTEFPVIISGGGPVGMATASLLVLQGVRSVVLERNTSPNCGQSRAITVQRDILALFDRIGIVDEILDDGASWSLGRTYYRDQEILRLNWPVRGEDVYRAFVNFPQFRTEELLHAATERTGLVAFRHGRTVGALRHDETSVAVQVEGPAGPERFDGAHRVGADGIGSTVRKVLGIPYDGWQTEGRFLVADFEVEFPLAVERRQWFDPPFSPSGIVLIQCMGERKLADRLADRPRGRGHRAAFGAAHRSGAQRHRRPPVHRDARQHVHLPQPPGCAEAARAHEGAPIERIL